MRETEKVPYDLRAAPTGAAGEPDFQCGARQLMDRETAVGLSPRNCEAQLASGSRERNRSEFVKCSEEYSA